MKPIPEQSFYEILEIPRDAPLEEVEKAYQRAKALYAPGSLAIYSLVAPEEMALLNRRIEEAHRVLLDAGTRAGYDATLPDASWQRGAPPPAALPPASEGAGAAIPAAPAGPVTPAADGAAAGAEAPPPEAPAAALGGAPPGQAEPVPVAPAEVAPIPATPSPVAPSVAAAPEPGATGQAASAPAPAEASQQPPVPGAAPVTAAAMATPPVASAARPGGFSVPEGAAWTGEMLRQARQGRGLTLHQLAERTKVGRHHLENIEADRYRLLPAPVYLRGILISLAKELRLDPQKVSRSYLDAARAAEAPPAPPKPR